MLVSAQSICSAIPPGRGENPNVNMQMLIQQFRNLGPYPAHRDDFGNLQLVYIQENDNWDYRTIRVLSHAGAFGTENGSEGIFRHLTDLFRILAIIPREGDTAMRSRAVLLAGGASSGYVGGLAVGAFAASKIAVAHAEKVKKIVVKLAKSLGVNEVVVFEALKKTALWLVAHPGVIIGIVIVAAAGVGVAVAEVYAEKSQFERDVRNVSQLFQDMIQFLRNRRYRDGNLICYAIDEREIYFWNIFQKDLGTWVGPMNVPNLPNVVVDERYYGKFRELTAAIDNFFRTEGVPRGLRVVSEENHQEA
jgi:hypothetical protein